jgi:hypothetical protein
MEPVLHPFMVYNTSAFLARGNILNFALCYVALRALNEQSIQETTW